MPNINDYDKAFSKNSLSLLIGHLFTYVELLFSYLVIMVKSLPLSTNIHSHMRACVCIHRYSRCLHWLHNYWPLLHIASTKRWGDQLHPPPLNKISEDTSEKGVISEVLKNLKEFEQFYIAF